MTIDSNPKKANSNLLLNDINLLWPVLHEAKPETSCLPHFFMEAAVSYIFTIIFCLLLKLFDFIGIFCVFKFHSCTSFVTIATEKMANYSVSNIAPPFRVASFRCNF